MSKTKEQVTQDYEVGYAKPPRQHRFKPGQSGNPKGRPPRRKHIPFRMLNNSQIHYDFFSVIEQDVKVSINNKNVILPAIIALYQRLLTKALAGDHRAWKLIMETRYEYASRRNEAVMKAFENFIEVETEMKTAYRSARTEAEKQRLEEKYKAYCAEPAIQNIFSMLNETVRKLEF